MVIFNNIFCRARGTFYLRTEAKEPFVLGPKGAYCESAKDDLTNVLENQMEFVEMQ